MPTKAQEQRRLDNIQARKDEVAALKAKQTKMDQITVYRLIVLKKAIGLEYKGMTRRGRSAKSMACEELGLSRNTGHPAVVGAIERKIKELEHAVAR